MPKFIIPCREPVLMKSPYGDGGIQKYRFYVNANDIPQELSDWMSPNPREQNLNSPVAKTIANSLIEPHQEFHLRNRGILLSAASVTYEDGNAIILMEDPIVHGDIDGGHTLKIILAAEKPLPEKYVEFEVLTGLMTAVEVAEARNTSAALDMRSLEEAKSTFDYFKKLFDGQSIGGDLFAQRIEWKQNQQQEVKNRIDIRLIISILLMYNRDLYPVNDEESSTGQRQPMAMYGAKENAIKNFLSLGDTREERDAILDKMSPIFLDILCLWDTVEMEFSAVDKKYQKLDFVTKMKSAHTLFSDRETIYVPQAILFPVVAAFRFLVQVDAKGVYSWRTDPFEAWNQVKQQMCQYVMNDLKTFKNTLSRIAKDKQLWSGLALTVQANDLRNRYDTGI